MHEGDGIMGEAVQVGGGEAWRTNPALERDSQATSGRSLDVLVMFGCV